MLLLHSLDETLSSQVFDDHLFTLLNRAFSIDEIQKLIEGKRGFGFSVLLCFLRIKARRFHYCHFCFHGTAITLKVVECFT